MADLERINEIESEKSPSNIIKLSLFDKQSNKTTKLILNNSEDNYINGSNREYKFELKNKIFISQIDIYTDGYSSYTEVEFGYKVKGGSYIVSKGRPNENGVFVFRVDEFIDIFYFKPPKRYLSSAILKEVRAFGYISEDFDEVVKKVGRFARFKAEFVAELKERLTSVVKREESIEDLEEKIIELKGEIEELSSTLSDHRALRVRLEKEITESKESLDKLSSRHKDIIVRSEALSDSINNKTNERQALNTEISEKQIDLKRLRDDINMFPSEISGYVQQGSNSISKYTILSVIPLFIILWISFELFKSARDFRNIVQLSDVSVYEMLLSRLPFVVVSTALVAASAKISQIFIGEIIDINRKRQDLYKISIIASEVSKSSEESLSLSDDEVYHLRTRTRMELLKEHLRNHIGSNYQYPIPERASQVEMFDSESDSSEDAG